MDLGHTQDNTTTPTIDPDVSLGLTDNSLITELERDPPLLDLHYTQDDLADSDSDESMRSTNLDDNTFNEDNGTLGAVTEDNNTLEAVTDALQTIWEEVNNVGKAARIQTRQITDEVGEVGALLSEGNNLQRSQLNTTEAIRQTQETQTAEVT